MSLTVLYDADCDFCRHSSHVLHSLDSRGRLRFTPLQSFAATEAGDPSLAALSDRLHVRDDDGSWASGGGAMIRLAAEIPLLAPLALVGGLPGVEVLVDAGYRLVADHRGAISRWLRLDRCRFEPGRPTTSSRP